MLIGNPHGGQIFALFSEHLDALIVGVKMMKIVGLLFAVEIHRSGPWRLGIGGHLQFFAGWFLELRP